MTVLQKRVLALVPARGGSKGLPGKNIADLGGRPLIAWSIAAALECTAIDRVVVSTDDDAIAAAAQACGAEVPFMRPASLAADDTPSHDVVCHALDTLDDDIGIVVLLQPTSPLRTSADIDACLALLDAATAPSAVSVTDTGKAPEWMFRMTSGHHLSPLLGNWAVGTRRQDLEPAYALNGAVYAAFTDWLRGAGTFVTPETVASVMPAARSIDIDTALDLEVVRALLPHVAAIRKQGLS